MKKKYLFAFGVTLLALGLCLGLYSLIWGHFAAKKARATALTLEEKMPAITQGIPQLRTDPAMPVFSLEGKDYIGVLRVPGFDAVLPVAASWDAAQLKHQPCRFSGSPYDGSLIIGGIDRRGQFDFADRIDRGDTLTFTDMTGIQYTFRVEAVERKDNAQAQTLGWDQPGLTLFVRSAYSGEYILIRCQ